MSHAPFDRSWRQRRQRRLVLAGTSTPVAVPAPVASLVLSHGSVLLEVPPVEQTVASLVLDTTELLLTLPATPTNEAPVVTMTAPLDGETYAYGATVALRATATDPEDGALLTSGIAWSSSVDGVLGTGNLDLVVGTDLTAGVAHTLTATSPADSGGLTGAAIATVVLQGSGSVGGGNGSVTPSAMAGARSTTVYVPDDRDTATASLPRTYLDSRSPALRGQYEGTVWDIDSFAGADDTAKLLACMQAIYDGTVMGSDIIELNAKSTGAAYTPPTAADLGDRVWALPPRPIDAITGTFTTRDPSGENLTIWFRTKRHAELPAEGYRPQPWLLDGTRTAGGPDDGKFFHVPFSGNRATVATPRPGNSNPYDTGAFTAEQAGRASHYRITGLETGLPTFDSASQIVCFGSPSSADHTSLDVIPTDLVLDRSWVYGDPTFAKDMKAAVGLHCKRGAVVDCVIEDTGGTESMGIVMYNGPGPFKIVGNTIIGSTMCILAGGAENNIPDCFARDLEIRRNDMAKWTFWNSADSTYVARPLSIKNIFEYKSAQYTLMEGNVFRNCWAAGQLGAGCLIKSVQQSEGRDWVKTTDLVIRFNHYDHVPCMFSMAANPQGVVAEVLSRVLVEHNIGTNIGVPWTQAQSNTNGAFVINSGPVVDGDYRWNTCICQWQGIKSNGSGVNVRGGFRGNVIRFGDNSLLGGIQDDGGTGGYNPPQGSASFETFWPDGEWMGNIIFATPSAKVAQFDQTNENVVLTSVDDVGFVSPATNDYQITGTYAAYGADWLAVTAYTSGVRDDAVGEPT